MEDRQRNPYNGLLLNNTSGKLLLKGPITIFEGNSYGGETELPNLTPGVDSVIRYSMALDITVDWKQNPENSSYTSIKTVAGATEVSRKLKRTTSYTINNRGSSRREMILYVRDIPGWEIADKSALWRTENNFNRFRLPLPAGGKTEFTVEQFRIIAESINLNPANWQQISAIIASAALDEKQKKQWRKAVELKQSLTTVERECKRLERAVQVAIDNQSRTRSNMGRIDRNTEFFQQLTKRLAEESMTIDKLQREVVEAQGQADNSRRELEEYLNKLEF